VYHQVETMAEEKREPGKFVVVVATKPEEFEVRGHELMRSVSENALHRAGFDRDLSKWELKNSTGEIVSFDQTEREAGVKTGSKYFLTQKIGAGG
jgi:hypothetical protein